jgi:hypothetical protein
MENNRKPKVVESPIDHYSEFRSEDNNRQLELSYLVRRQWKESICLIMHSSTILFIALLFLSVAWFISSCPRLTSFIANIVKFQTEINFNVVEEGKIFMKSIRLPTEILILIAIFLWRFSPAAFLNKRSKERSE